MDTSQFGEDGIIQNLLERLGITNKWCIELGALNGLHHSNTRRLIAEEGWSGVLIEADPTYFEKLVDLYRDTPRVYPAREFVSFEGGHRLDAILARTPIPKDPDLLSLDVDGNEYHLLDSLTDYRPRLVVVEFNPTIPNDVVFVQPRDMSVYQGSSLRALVGLGKRKGYELVAANDTNGFFVPAELFSRLGIADNAIDTIHINHQYETKLYQLYDGTICIAGYDRLFWHKIPIDTEKLQILPKRKRKYPARISEHPFVRRAKYWARKLPVYEFIQNIRHTLS